MTRSASHGRLLGVDGVRGGWVAAQVDRHGTVEWRQSTSVAQLLPTLLTGDVLAVDAPLELCSTAPRPCDVAARRMLPGRASTVFPAPLVATLDDYYDGVDHAEAVRRARRRGVPAPSRQTWNIMDKIADVVALRATADPASLIVECHPELSFATMAGRVLDPKRTPAGRRDRCAALRAWLPDIALATTPPGVPVTDALDALACAWTAHRVADDSAQAVGVPPALIWV